MDAIIKQFFDKKVGDFLKVDAGNLRVDAATGQFVLKKASIVGQAFDGLHLPVTLRGGFIDELSIHLHLDVFNRGGNVSLQILIKNVFLLFGPQTTDWSYDHVKQCKSKIVDLVMKILELKPAKKRRAAEETATGWLSDIQTRIKQDLMKKVAEMIEVNIANFHVRFEDSVTQPVPFACGFKLGYAAVFSNEDNSSQRTTGYWRHTVDNLADPLFCQPGTRRRNWEMIGAPPFKLGAIFEDLGGSSMGLSFGRLWQLIWGPKEVNVLMLGLDAAGKTTILYKLKIGEVLSTVPTIGFNVETVQYGNLSLCVWDVGGQEKLRNLWRHYYKGGNALIFVLDSADHERLPAAREALQALLREEETA
ncbi:unnamed protein product [Effrenium voratum]|nr:unnamed protein product [Effrenium voratum]